MRVAGWACQVTVRATSVRVVPLMVTGVVSGALVTVAVQPGTGLVLTSRNGLSCGRVTFTLTVPAVSDSLGTRKVSWLTSGLGGVRVHAHVRVGGLSAQPSQHRGHDQRQPCTT